MSVLIFIDTNEGHVKKASFEAMTYGAKVAELLGTTAEGVVLGTAKKILRHLANTV
jgi:electron transfer flavoprotein alpha subunit